MPTSESSESHIELGMQLHMRLIAKWAPNLLMFLGSAANTTFVKRQARLLLVESARPAKP